MHSETHSEILGAALGGAAGEAAPKVAAEPPGDPQHPDSRNCLKVIGNRSRAGAGKFRFGITWKMFLAVLIACLAISLTMGYALRLSFENGFLHYVRARDAERLNAVMAKVTAEYAAHGNWNFLRQHPEEWVALLDAAHDQALRQEMVEAQTNKLPSWRTFPGSASVQQLLGPLSGKEEGPHWGMRLPAPAFADSALYGGYIVPILAGPGIYAIGLITEDRVLTGAGSAAVQALGVTVMATGLLKWTTGRVFALSSLLCR